MVHLVQYLCPQGHCVAAMAYEEGVGNFKEACKAIKKMLRNARAGYQCGLCMSRQLRFVDDVTRFQTMAEAEPQLEREAERFKKLRETLGTFNPKAGQ